MRQEKQKRKNKKRDNEKMRILKNLEVNLTEKK